MADTLQKGRRRTIALIDDDYAMGVVAEHLTCCGFQVQRIASAAEALTSIDALITVDGVILDIIMKRPETAGEPQISGDRSTGMLILSALREKNPDIPVLVYSCTNDPDLIETIRRLPHTAFLHKWSTPSLRELLDTVERLIGIEPTDALPHSFIVHGHDDIAKLSLKNYIQNTLGFPEPVVLHERPSVGRTVIEKFEEYAVQTDLVFVILTPDDKCVAPAGTNDEKRRGRQNVIFELGYFLGTLGRSSGRVILLHKGPLELPTDLAGLIYIDISNGIDAAGEAIRRELSSVL